jgi:hypothetical protein
MSTQNQFPLFIPNNTETAEVIGYSDAMEMHRMYKEHPDCLRFPDGRIMKGFRIGKDQIESMLEIDGFKDLFVFFAVHPYTKNMAINSQRFTLVFAPLKAVSATDIYGQIVEEGPLYEYVDPCPDKCPTNLK